MQSYFFLRTLQICFPEVYTDSIFFFSISTNFLALSIMKRNMKTDIIYYTIWICFVPTDLFGRINPVVS